MSLSCELGFWRKILIPTLARSESPFLWIPISQLLTRVVQENLDWQESRLLSWYFFRQILSFRKPFQSFENPHLDLYLWVCNWENLWLQCPSWQHFKARELAMLARCLCAPLVSIRVGKVSRQGHLLCPTTTRSVHYCHQGFCQIFLLHLSCLPSLQQDMTVDLLLLIQVSW